MFETIPFSEIAQNSTIPPNPPLPPDSSEFPTSETKPPDSFIPDPEKLETQGGSPEETSEETSSETPESSGGGAFNPQTGEINWDCPCLGGMAHGPCGPEFKEAFSCFVFSEVEPKGIDCVEKFKTMQNCFRAHPEDYADGLYSRFKCSPSPDQFSRNYG
jgi:intermembrane space import and assembly protein 40